MPTRKKQLPQTKPRANKPKPQQWKRKETAQKKFLEEVGSRGADPRMVGDETVTPEDLVYKDSIEAIISRPALVQQSYWTPLLTIFSQAMSKGFSATSQDQMNPFAPYYAFVYLVQSIEAAVNDAEPPMTEAPLWFTIWYQMMRPMKSRFRTGTIDYKFTVNPTGDNGFGVVPPSSIDWLMEGTAWNFGSVAGDGTDVNGYLVLLAPPAYTPALGAEAWGLVVQFFANEKRYPMWKQVPLTDPIFKTPDPSAYAAAFNEIGAAFGSNAGIVTELFSEVFVNSPVFGVFSSYEQNVFRAFSHSRQYGGGGCYLGGRIQEALRVNDVRGKVRPTFKFIDFNEFYEVAALWLAGAMSLAQTNLIQEEVVPLICPLSVQDFRIMLRQIIMFMFEDSQSMTEDLYYQGVDTFFPFLVSTGTCGKDVAAPAVLPIIMTENLRALMRRTVATKPVHIKGGASYPAQVIDFVPCWGMWQSDIAKIDNYSYTTATGAGPFPVFSTVPDEQVINLIDGAATIGSTPIYYPLDLNGAELVKSVQEWNEFLQTKLAANSCTLSPVGCEKGISALEMITISEVMSPVPPVVPPDVVPVQLTAQIVGASPQLSSKSLQKKNSSVKIKHLGRARREFIRYGLDNGPILGSISPYSLWSTNFVCSNQKIVANCWAECQVYWIGPTTRTTGALNDLQNFSSYQSQSAEPHSFYLSASGGSVGIISPNGVIQTYQRHQIYAALMYGPAAGRSTTLEDFLTNAAITGRGGFLGKVVGGFLGGIIGQGEMGAELGDALL